MIGQGPTLFQSKILSNPHQESLMALYARKNLTYSAFIGYDWFNSYPHERAFIFLVDKKNLSFNEAFTVLNKLEPHQARGIFLGLNREEVQDLTEHQIDAYLKYGLPKSDLMGLSKHQIRVLLALKNEGIKPCDLINENWLNNEEHIHALFYLMRVKKYNFIAAANYLKDLTSNEANAISYGIEDRIQIEGLPNDLIEILINRKKTDGLQNREDIEILNKTQRNLVERFYHFGLTSKLAFNHIKQTGPEFESSFRRLILEKGMGLHEVIQKIAGLDGPQVYGLSIGLSEEEVNRLNPFQIEALGKCKTIKNGLEAECFYNQDWFNSKNHVDALVHMLSLGKFTANEAMNELNGLTAYEATQVSEGKKRDDIIGLNEFQLKAINGKLRWRGLKGSDLRDNAWFNSDNHVATLDHLIEKKHHTVQSALTQMKDLDANQVILLITENVGRETILKLTPIQINILNHIYDYGFYAYHKNLVDATWLTTNEQEALLKVLSKFSTGGLNSLAVVKHLSETNQVQETLEKINKGEIKREQITKLFDTLKNESIYASRQTMYSPQPNTTNTAQQSGASNQVLSNSPSTYNYREACKIM